VKAAGTPVFPLSLEINDYYFAHFWFYFLHFNQMYLDNVKAGENLARS